jgi:putative transposase
MARIAGVVVPGLQHHVTRRGNRREPVFFRAEDYRFCRRLIATAARRDGAEIWAYCLMPNHIRLIVTPADRDGLRRTFGEAHRRHTGGDQRAVRLDRPSVPGSLRRGGDGRAAPAGGARYIALDPVVAGLVSHAGDWPWSSTRAHLAGEDDELAAVPFVARSDPRFCGPSRRTGRSRDDGSDRADADDRTTAGSPEWVTALERRLGTRQTRTKAASGPRARAAAAVAVDPSKLSP